MLLAVAVLPETGRDAVFRLAQNATDAGYADADSAGELAGHFAPSTERLVVALHVVEMIATSPDSLAGVLEAVGAVSLGRAGAILDEQSRELGRSVGSVDR